MRDGFVGRARYDECVRLRLAMLEALRPIAGDNRPCSRERMAHLWIEEAARWAALPLHADGLRLADAEAPLLRRGRTPEGETWVVIGGRDVFVNGRRLAAGMRVLRDRDEIRVGDSSPIFFSCERLAAIEAFAGASGPAYCPRCKQELLHETPVVRCPQCRVAHHQTDELPCWTYTPACALCDQPTALDGAYRWRPEAADEEGDEP
jgi:hypothetical protein